MDETRRMRPLLGTYVEIGVAGRGGPTHAGIDAAFGCIRDIGERLSFQDPDSELSQLNRSSGRWVPMGIHAMRVLRLARDMMLASGGRFNCTVGGQLVAWGALPRHWTLARLPKGCADDLQLRPDAALLKRPVCITLDGIAKGYAVDCAVQVLKRLGAKHGWINAGGDLRVFGDRALPVVRSGRGGRSSVLQLRNAAIATSVARLHGDPDHPGRLVGVAAGVEDGAGFSVVAARAWRADALTKVAAACSPGERKRVVCGLRGLLPWEQRPCAA